MFIRVRSDDSLWCIGNLLIDHFIVQYSSNHTQFTQCSFISPFHISSFSFIFHLHFKFHFSAPFHTRARKYWFYTVSIFGTFSFCFVFLSHKTTFLVATASCYFPSESRILKICLFHRNSHTAQITLDTVIFFNIFWFHFTINFLNRFDIFSRKINLTKT